MAIDLRWRSVSFYNDISLFPIVGSINILYVDRTAMLIYIWNGSSYEATESGSGGSSITVVANYAALPDPTTVTASFYWCSASQGTAWLPGALGGSYHSSGLYYSNGTTWEYMSSPYQATQVEVDAGTNTDKFLTPETYTNSTLIQRDSTPTASSTNLVTSGGVEAGLGTKQATLVSGTNIKTVNGNTLLGSGDLVISGGGGTPAGITGQIQFNNGGAFGADSLFVFDPTTKAFGVGVSAPNGILNAVGGVSELRFSSGAGSTTPTLAVINTGGSGKAVALAAGTGGSVFAFDNSGFFGIIGESKATINSNSVGSGTIHLRVEASGNVGIGASSALARLDVRAQGALSTDIAFRVRNSANTLDSFYVNGLGQGGIKSNSYTPRFAVSYDWAGGHRDAFVFTQNIQNFRGQTWTFDAGYNGSAERLIISNDLTSNEQGYFSICKNNFNFGKTYHPAETSSERRVLRIYNGVAPSARTIAETDFFKMYSADISAGNAAPHFETENGSIVKLYQETSVTTPQGIADALTNLGVLASSTIANSIPTHDGTTYDTNAIQTLTAAEYAAIGTPNASTIYFIV